MANSIKREGLLNPIIVYKAGDLYKLVAGERRTLASKIAGKEDIQAKVLEGKPSPLKLSMLQWYENIEREDLTLWERMVNLQQIISNYEINQGIQKISPKELKDLIGCSVQQATNYCCVLESEDKLKEAIKANKLRNLEKAALVARVVDPRIKEKALEGCINGATLSQLKVLISSTPKLNKPNTEEPERRGRQATRINLGATKSISTVKSLIDAILQVDKYKKLQNIVKDTDWQDFASIAKSFQTLIQEMEKEGVA